MTILMIHRLNPLSYSDQDAADRAATSADAQVRKWW